MSNVPHINPSPNTPSSSPQTTNKLRQLSLHSQPIMRVHNDQTQPDEGYSEEDSHHSDTEMNIALHISDADDASTIIQKILTLPVDKRKEIAQALIPSLPNPEKEELKLLIDHLTHFDPAIYLPNELFLLTFSYLTPQELLIAGRVSRAWRSRSLDERLWRGCFAREGWLMDPKQTELFERLAERRGAKIVEGVIKSSGRARMDDEGTLLTLERRSSRKRGRDEAFNDADHGLLGSFGDTLQHVDGSADDRADDADVERMEGVEIASPAQTAIAPPPSLAAADISNTTLEDTTRNAADFTIGPTVFQPTTSVDQKPKLSWPYLYKQRRRLEANWESGAYKMFQLPHPDHQNEGHDECVYTIQHTHRHLVSGSRDRTIRIWNLATYRLKREPLVGHEASVLCLQFDERPEQDIIVSGGSDAYVIVWKFSTGEILKKMTKAHDESVLNLRFDDRYIVTCSKDKSIKIWNRHALARDSPLIPLHVLQDFAPVGNVGPGDLIAEYSLLAVLNGHHAAVNAVMIHDNTIVSASGDRTIKSWDIRTGQFKKNYMGHSKGIACVQFDGRRIVSGSSDNTVRIFDAEQQAEVACLTGHTNLVRTVQARFGDLDIVTAEELAAEAKKADLGFYAALAKGMQPASVSSRHGSGQRNAGSSRPEDMLALGTKVPPGGGGSRWAKIVSGSYDEQVILWKRDRDGKWFPKLRLRQDEQRPTSRRRTQAGGPPQTAQATQATNNAGTGPVSAVQAQAHHHISTAQGHLVQANQLLRQQRQGQQLLPASQMAAMTSAQNHLTQQLGQQSAQPAAQQQGQQQGVAATQNQATNVVTTVATAQQQQQQASNNQVQSANITTTTTGNQQPAATATGNQTQQQPLAAIGPAGPPPPAHTRESNRVFKLQFDARRIVCCSQNKVIVGWDFANGDPELERVGEWSLETA